MSSSPSGDRGHGRGRGGRTCHRCGGEGHIARYCRQKVDIRRPSRTELGSGGDESVDPTKSSEPLAARGRGESKYYKGEDPDPEPSPQKEAPKPSPHEPSLPAPETLNRDQPTAAEPSTNPSETPQRDPPPAPWRHQNDAAVVDAPDTLAGAQPPAQPLHTHPIPTSTSSAPPPQLGGHLAAQEHAPRLEPQPRGNTGTAVEAPAAAGQHTGADIGPWVGESGEQGWVRFPVMVRTLIELGDRRVVVFVWPKEGYEALRQRLGRGLGLEVEVVRGGGLGLAVEWWPRVDAWFPERTFLDEGNFEGALALVGRRWGGDVLVVYWREGGCGGLWGMGGGGFVG